jgi:hypothetical protein
MSKKHKIFENAIVVSLESTAFGMTKISKVLTKDVVDRNGIKMGRAKTSINIVAKEYDRNIRKPVRHARNLISETCVPWTEAKVDRNAKKTGRSWHLCMGKHWKELREGVEVYEEEWRRQTRMLFDNWNTILVDAPTDLSIGYDPKHFPPLEEVREAYFWFLHKEHIRDVSSDNDIRLEASDELIRECMESARHAENMRISNAIGSMAHDIKDFAEKVSGQVGGYDPDPEDGRKNNTLPKAPTWKELSRLTNTLEDMNEMFVDDAFSETVAKMRELEDRIKDIGSADDVRELLKGGGRERNSLKERIDNIGRAVLPALNRYDGLAK